MISEEPLKSHVVDMSNPYVNKLKKFIKTHFIQTPRDFYKDIIESHEQILASEKIFLRKVIKKHKDRSADSRYNSFMRMNAARVDDNDCIIEELSSQIIDLLKNYRLELSKPSKRISTRSYEYKNAEEDEDDEDLITPNDNTDLNSVKLNLFYNKDVNYKYVAFEEPHPIDKSSSTIQNLRLKINGVLEHNIVPIKRKAICTEKDKGVECGNEVFFSDVHLNSKIKCTDSLPKVMKDGHTIKNLNKAMVAESAIWYVYEGSDLINQESTEIIICSLVPINTNTITCNAIFVNDESNTFVLVLSIKEEKIEELKEPILIKDKDSKYFLDDLYKSIQQYLRKYHNIILTNQNKIIGQIIMFQLLNNIFYHKRMNSLIVGKSGSGKSIWSELLIPLFTLNHKTILGTDVTRNKFIGGRSNLISSSVNSLFSAGYIATQNMIFAEECTNSLKDFQDSTLNQSNNIFHLIKACSGKEVDVAIQGGQKVYPKASTVLVGNLEQLSFTQEYKTLVASKYRKLCSEMKKEYKEKYPLFKPIGYYVNELKNIELAEAHSIVRQTYKNIAGYHYITRLPPAEMARYAFFVAIEDDLDDKRIRRELKKNESLENPKREHLIKELSKIFMDEENSPKEIPYKLKEQINDFYNDEYYDERNNFKTIFGVNQPINAHIENNIITIMEQLIWMNKLYRGEEKTELTENDKEIVRYFLSFNYNTLSLDEAAGRKKPYINDFNDLKKDSINIDLESKEKFFEKIKQQKEDDEAELKKMLDDDTATNIL